MRNSIWKVAAIGVLFAPICLSADSFYTLVGYECENDRLTLTYDGAYNEDGKKMVANKRDTQWDPKKLVTIEETEEYARIVDTTSVKAECVLSDGVYQIELFPYPGNSNIQGLCGAWMGAKAKVIKDNKTLYENIFSEDCHHRNYFYPEIEGITISRVIFTPKQVKPQIVSSSVEDFHNGSYNK